MKSLFLFLFFLEISYGVLAQSFEGEIIYQISYKSKLSGIKDADLNVLFGDEQEYYIKGNNYRSFFNGSLLKSQLYKGNENKSFTLTGKSDTLYWEYYNKDNPVISDTVELRKDTVFGLSCDLLTIVTPVSKTCYYFNKRYSADPELYNKDLYANWFLILNKTRSLPLKTVYENNEFIRTSTAINIVPMKLNDSFFNILDENKIAPLR
jgi:hypothetical protein